VARVDITIPLENHIRAAHHTLSNLADHPNCVQAAARRDYYKLAGMIEALMVARGIRAPRPKVTTWAADNLGIDLNALDAAVELGRRTT
jgi:hypothetical protein